MQAVIARARIGLSSTSKCDATAESIVYNCGSLAQTLVEHTHTLCLCVNKIHKKGSCYIENN